MTQSEQAPSGLQPKRKIARAEAERAQLFRNTDLDAIWPLLEQCPVRDVPAGHVLIVEGELSRNVYLLLEGRLQVQLDAARKDIVASIEPGQTVGEFAPIDHRPRSATVLATEDCRVLDVTEDTFWALLRTSHGFALRVLETLCERLRGVNVSLAESRRLQQELKRQANVDPLTNLGNRRWLDEVLQYEVSSTANEGRALSLVMIDIDHFKLLNDTYGHSAGDAVLAMVATALRCQFRPTDRVARYGGEEFTVILPCTPLAGAVQAANRVRHAIAEATFSVPGSPQPIPVTISAGVAEARANENVAAILLRADQALYQAKHAGRNQVCASPESVI